MKKIVALLLAVLVALTAVSALAAPEQIGQTRLSIDLGDLEMYELTAEDAADDAVLTFGTEDERMQCMVYVYDADGLTLQDIESEMLSEGGISASGYTTINGIDCFCVLIDDEEGSFVIYLTIVDGEMVQFDFLYDADTAELTGKVMNTLRIN